jgi:hypothetical protein
MYDRIATYLPVAIYLGAFGWAFVPGKKNAAGVEVRNPIFPMLMTWAVAMMVFGLAPLLILKLSPRVVITGPVQEVFQYLGRRGSSYAEFDMALPNGTITHLRGGLVGDDLQDGEVDRVQFLTWNHHFVEISPVAPVRRSWHYSGFWDEIFTGMLLFPFGLVVAISCGLWLRHQRKSALAVPVTPTHLDG